MPSLSGADVASASRVPLNDINTASAEQLATLPGIGEVRAGRIIDSRERDGPFASADELLERVSAASADGIEWPRHERDPILQG